MREMLVQETSDATSTESNRGSQIVTTVLECAKLLVLPPCAGDRFMSNIMVFPTATHSGWPFAPKQTPGAKTVLRFALDRNPAAWGLALLIAIVPPAAPYRVGCRERRNNQACDPGRGLTRENI